MHLANRLRSPENASPLGTLVAAAAVRVLRTSQAGEEWQRGSPRVEAGWAQTAAEISLRRIFMKSDGLLRTVRSGNTVRLLQSIKNPCDGVLGIHAILDDAVGWRLIGRLFVLVTKSGPELVKTFVHDRQVRRTNGGLR